MLHKVGASCVEIEIDLYTEAKPQALSEGIGPT